MTRSESDRAWPTAFPHTTTCRSPRRSPRARSAACTTTSIASECDARYCSSASDDSGFTGTITAPMRAAAIHVERLASHVVGHLRGEEDHRLGDILGLAHARNRLRADVVVEATGHLACNRSGADGIHQDAVLAGVLGHPLGKRNHAALRRRVSRSASPARALGRARDRAAQLARDRADIDDLATALPLHWLVDRLGKQVRAL